MYWIEGDSSDGGGCFGAFRHKQSESTMNLLGHGRLPPNSFDSSWSNNNAPTIVSPDHDSDTFSPAVVSSMLAKELSRLSIQEREKAENDVHGIPDDQIETPELLRTCLQEMDAYLQASKSRTAFELAEAIDRRYTSDEKFRTKFIRAELYQASEAAERFIRFFELKKSLFGVNLLTKDILLEHLNEDDMEALKSGGLQLCPLKDTAGRPVVSIMLGMRKYKEPENMQRACFYIYMVLSKDEVAQIRGIVNISYAIGYPRFKSVQVSLRKAIPLHIACQHFAYDDPSAFSSATYGIAMLNKVHRVRFRCHIGTHVECLYALATYGIPVKALPVNTKGEVSTDHHLAWIAKRRAIEESPRTQYTRVAPGSSSFSSRSSPVPAVADFSGQPPPIIIPQPKDTDILFGRGKSVVGHPGNTWFREVVDNIMRQYESGTRLEKASMGNVLVDFVKNSGGRFLKPNDDGDAWEEVDDHTARQKVAHTFRNRRKFHTSSNSAPTEGSTARSFGPFETLF